MRPVAPFLLLLLLLLLLLADSLLNRIDLVAALDRFGALGLTARAQFGASVGHAERAQIENRDDVGSG